MIEKLTIVCEISKLKWQNKIGLITGLITTCKQNWKLIASSIKGCTIRHATTALKGFQKCFHEGWLQRIKFGNTRGKGSGKNSKPKWPSSLQVQWFGLHIRAVIGRSWVQFLSWRDFFFALFHAHGNKNIASLPFNLLSLILPSFFFYPQTGQYWHTLPQSCKVVWKRTSILSANITLKSALPSAYISWLLHFILGGGVPPDY